MIVIRTSQFEADQNHIEDHIFDSNEQQVQFVEKFIDELDIAVRWVQGNTTTPKENETGDRS